MKTRINRILTPLIIVLMAVAVSSCDDFDYNPNLENRTIYAVKDFTFNDNNLDNVEGCHYYPNPNYYSPSLKKYYTMYFEEIYLLAWDNGKYEINEVVLREETDLQKPKIKEGKKYFKFKRTKHNQSFDDKGWNIGTIKMVEVGQNRYDCEVYDVEYNVTFSVTVQFNDGVR